MEFGNPSRYYRSWKRKHSEAGKQESLQAPQLPLQKIGEQIEKLVVHNKIIDDYLIEHIKKFSIEPVYDLKKFAQFDQNKYPLEEHEKVRVVTEKVFSTGNYYNYIYEVEHQKELFRSVELARKQIEEQIARQKINQREAEKEQRSDTLIVKKSTQVEVVPGMHKTSFSTWRQLSQESRIIRVDQYAPVHRDYRQLDRSHYTKESERLQLATKNPIQ